MIPFKVTILSVNEGVSQSQTWQIKNYNDDAATDAAIAMSALPWPPISDPQIAFNTSGELLTYLQTYTSVPGNEGWDFLEFFSDGSALLIHNNDFGPTTPIEE